MSMLEGEVAYIKARMDPTGKKLADSSVKEEGMKFNVHLKAFDRAADSTDLSQDERLERAQGHKVAAALLIFQTE